MKKGVSTLLSVPIKLYNFTLACATWLLRYTYVFLHFVQVYAMLSDELTGHKAGHNVRQHGLNLGTDIKQHMRDKWEDSGLAEKLRRDYWKNCWNSWSWKETV